MHLNGKSIKRMSCLLLSITLMPAGVHQRHLLRCPPPSCVCVFARVRICLWRTILFFFHPPDHLCFLFTLLVSSCWISVLNLLVFNGFILRNLATRRVSELRRLFLSPPISFRSRSWRNVLQTRFRSNQYYCTRVRGSSPHDVISCPQAAIMLVFYHGWTTSLIQQCSTTCKQCAFHFVL